MADLKGISKKIQFETLETPAEKYVLDGFLAEGAFGAVYEANDRWKSANRVCVKVVPHIRRHLREIESEYTVLSELTGHANFPEFFGIFFNKPKSGPVKDEIWFVMELMELGSVGELTRRYNRRMQNLPQKVIGYVLASTVKALLHMHSKKFIYRDIKCDNILITAKGIIKLCDFGSSAKLASTMERKKTCVGSVCWMAPEVITCRTQDKDYDVRCDVWSIGICAIEMCDSVPPLANLPAVRALFHIAHNPPATIAHQTLWEQELIDFVSEALVKNPDHRPLMEELPEHPFLAPHAGDNNTEAAEELVKACLSSSQNLTGATPVGSTNVPQAITQDGQLQRDRNMPSEKLITEDLGTLETYNDQTLVGVLKNRWEEKKLYTWLADMLVAVNSNAIKHKYDDATHEMYAGHARCDNSPHIFAVADKAHQDGIHHKTDQTIIVTGESGSGKSFSFNRLMEHLMYLGARYMELVRKRIENVMTVMDVMGGATTELNVAATRHIRLFELIFSTTGKIRGMKVTISMLESLRINNVHDGDSNFHLLYCFYDGLSQTSRLKDYGLSIGRKYKLLVRYAGDHEVSNSKRFMEMENALKSIGFSDSELQSAYHILAAILLLGNVQFGRSNRATIPDQAPIIEAAKQLGVNDRDLIHQLTHNGRGPVSGDEATDMCYSLTECLYSRLVDTVVALINIKMAPRQELAPGEKTLIGVLDMPGFEATEYNTLQQLMVNVLNEQIQYFYNQAVFTWEMSDYETEGVEGIGNFSFPDNHHLLDLFLAKQTGVLELLDQETKRGNSDSFDSQLSRKKEARQITRNAFNEFSIAHFVGKVKYDTTLFVPHNRDSLTTGIVECLQNSRKTLVAAMFSCNATKTGQLPADYISSKLKKGAIYGNSDNGPNAATEQYRSQTRGLAFRHCLINVLYKLTHTSTHFVRCIRANMEEEDKFDSGMVKHQVKYLAFCDTITIRQQGFSHRLPFRNFLLGYKCLAFDYDENVDLDISNCRLLLLRLRMEGWAIGSTRVFLKYYMEEYISRLYEDTLRKIIKVQSMIKTYIQMKKLKSLAKGGKQLGGSPTDGNKGRSGGDEAKNISNRSRFNESTVEGEAARIVQYYYKRWKLHSLFQQLILYRAEKMKQLVYFSQQVHLYSQECQARACGSNVVVESNKIKNQSPGAWKNMIGGKAKAEPMKLPLDHTIASFFDTSYLCHPSRKQRQEDSDWQGPFKNKMSAQRAQNMGAGQYQLTSLPPVPSVVSYGDGKGNGPKKVVIPSFNNNNNNNDNNNYSSNRGSNNPSRNSNNYGGGNNNYNSNNNETREEDTTRDAPTANKGYNRFAAASPKTPSAQYNNFSYINAAGGNRGGNNRSPSPQVHISSWEEKNRGQRDGSPARGEFMKELKSKFQEKEPEFVNFQSKLRKTPQRSSMKQHSNYEDDRYGNNNYDDRRNNYDDRSSYKSDRYGTPDSTDTAAAVAIVEEEFNSAFIAHSEEEML